MTLFFGRFLLRRTTSGVGENLKPTSAGQLSVNEEGWVAICVKVGLLGDAIRALDVASNTRFSGSKRVVNPENDGLLLN